MARGRPKSAETDVAPTEPNSRPPRRLNTETLLLIAVVVLAGALRAVGLQWGLPNELRVGSYHPDEMVNLVNGVLINGQARPHLDIGFYNYGSFYFLLWQVAVAVNNTYGLVKLPVSPGSGPSMPDSAAAMLLIGRWISVVAGTGVCVLLWWAGKLVGRKGAGLSSAALFAVAPLAVVHAHFATVDMTATLLVTSVMVSALSFLRHPRLATLGMSGLLAGLAAATRYNTVLVVLAPLTAAFLAEVGAPSRRWLEWLTRCAAIVATCLVGFLVGCPGSLLNWSKFSSDVAFEMQKSREGMGLLFQDTGLGWVYHYTVSLYHGLGSALLAIVSLGVVLALARRTPAELVILTFVLAYYLLMGAAQVRFARYMLPLLPPLLFYAGGLMEPLCRPVVWRRAAQLTVAAGFLAGFGMAWAYVDHMRKPDARDLAAEFVSQNIPRGTSLAFGTVPWYWSPPLLPEFTAPLPGQVRRKLILTADADYILRLPAEDREWDPSVLDDPPPHAVILSDLETQDVERLRAEPGMEFLTRAREGRKAYVFGQRPSFFGVRVVSSGYLPNDLLYVCPRIEVLIKETSAQP